MIASAYQHRTRTAPSYTAHKSHVGHRNIPVRVCTGTTVIHMMLQIVGALAFLVLLGSTTIIFGVRYNILPSRALPIAFALTAASWLAFLIAAISATVILLGLPSV